MVFRILWLKSDIFFKNSVINIIFNIGLLLLCIKVNVFLKNKSRVLEII